MQIDVIAIFRNSSLIIQALYCILAVMSATGWAVIFAKSIQYFRAQRMVERDIAAFRQARTLAEALPSLSGDMESPSYKVVREGLVEYKQLEQVDATPGEKARILLENVRFSMRTETDALVGELGKSLSFLALCANAAPLMGLFGTVWGIFHSFQGFADMQQASILVVGAGLSEALATTIAGLLVAIPASVAYNFLIGKLSRVEARLMVITTSFLHVMKQDIAAGRVHGAAALSEAAGVDCGASDTDHDTTDHPQSRRRSRFPSFTLTR